MLEKSSAGEHLPSLSEALVLTFATAKETNKAKQNNQLYML